MKITDRLIGDHKTFRKMLDDLAAIARRPAEARDVKKLVRTAELFKDHLLIHAWFEDKFYYPAVAAGLGRFAGGPVTPDYMARLGAEHLEIDALIDRLEAEVKREPPAPSWPETLARFEQGLRAHMKKEEDELFPESERALGAARLEEMSAEFEKRRREAPKVRVHARE